MVHDYKFTSRKWKGHLARVKERTYDVNLVNAAMPSYSPLMDEHLQDYFNSPVTRKHLLKLGLVWIQYLDYDAEMVLHLFYTSHSR